ncbi:MAG: arylsulfatase, partial [Anaerolineae bacterium]|nr:arylsulfatase [Anaerolineae bacterium]
GLRFTQFYNTARCCPSRASLLTGLYPHQADVGHMTGNDGIDGYLGDLNPNSITIAEVLQASGYRTFMSGKWHVTRHTNGPKHNWPIQRGFEDYYGILTGCGNYYHPKTLTRNNTTIEAEPGYFITDAITDEAIRQIKLMEHDDTPIFQYVAYTAPHWPLHAHPEDIEKYKGRFDAGWDELRKQRLQRLIDMGIIHENWLLTERDDRVPPWDEVKEKAWEVRRMEVYAAQIDRMDQGIGRIFQALKDAGKWENTLIIFLADNGGCAEELTEVTGDWIRNPGEVAGTLHTWEGKEVRFGNEPSIIPGEEDTYASYGIPWANVSNTPFRLYKHWVHEGGIATPFIAHWPEGISSTGTLRSQMAQLPDLMATFVDIAGAPYPETFHGKEIKPLEGYSLVPAFNDLPTEREVGYWEHEGNKAVRKGKWKLVCKYPGDWELYNMEAGRTEVHDVSGEQPEIVHELSELYDVWAERCGVIPWDDLLALRKKNKKKEVKAW